MSQTFKLTDAEGKEIELSEDQLRAAGFQPVPAGSTVVPETEVKNLRDSVETLTGQVK